MHILFLLSNYPGYGGIEKVTDYISKYLVDQHYKITILSYGTNTPSLIKTLTGVIFTPKDLDYTGVNNTEFINQYLATNVFDYIVLQDSYAPIEHIFAEIDYPWNEKLIVVEHNTPLYAIKTINSYFYYNKGLKFFFERIVKYVPSLIKAYISSRYRKKYLLKYCCKYVLLSESFKKEIRFLVGTKYNDKLISITNPLTIPESTLSGFDEFKKKQILFVGRVSNQKGFHFLLEIWKEFSKSNIDNWELVMLAAGEGKEQIIQEISKNRLSNIRIDKPTTEIYRYYEESAVLVMTSIYEGFPLVLAEAMSRGCVPMAFDSFRSVHDIIENEKDGILIRPFDTTQYAKKLSVLINDSKRRCQLAKSAIEKAKDFKLDIVGHKWIELFEDLKCRV